MERCSLGIAPIVKDAKLNKFQYSRNEIEREEMRFIPYTSIVGNLVYTHACMHANIIFVVSMLGLYQFDLGIIIEKLQSKLCITYKVQKFTCSHTDSLIILK